MAKNENEISSGDHKIDYDNDILSANQSEIIPIFNRKNESKLSDIYGIT